DVLDEVTLQVARLEQSDVGAVPLDGADPGQRRHQRFRNTRADEELGLLDAWERLLPPLERYVDQLGGKPLAVLRTPCVDRSGTKLGARRDVAAGFVEAAVVPHSAGDQWSG